MDIFKFVHEVSDLIEYRSTSEFPTLELFTSVRMLEKDHPQLELPADLINKSFSIEDRGLFYEICDDVVSHSYTALVRTMENIFPYSSMIWKRI